MTLQTSPENSLKQTLKNLENPWKNLPKITSKIRPSPDTRFSQKITSRSLTLGSQNGAKNGEKNDYKYHCFLDRSENGFGRPLGGPRGPKRDPKGEEPFVPEFRGGVPFHI